MKNKFITLMMMFFLISAQGFSQDTTHVSNVKKHTRSIHYTTSKNSSSTPSTKYKYKRVAKKPLYRDTRLGGSSKQYDTYKKNDNGAGAVTNNPKK
ncbi:MAG: hypothetical protein M3R50_06565 [Bacteroidota bacterium]|nr:hypothetical protein [Bacteroidota bacterium]